MIVIGQRETLDMVIQRASQIVHHPLASMVGRADDPVDEDSIAPLPAPDTRSLKGLQFISTAKH